MGQASLCEPGGCQGWPQWPDPGLWTWGESTLEEWAPNSGEARGPPRNVGIGTQYQPRSLNRSANLGGGGGVLCVFCLNISFILSDFHKGRERCVREKAGVRVGISLHPSMSWKAPREATGWNHFGKPLPALPQPGKRHCGWCFMAAMSWRVCQALSVKSLGL